MAEYYDEIAEYEEYPEEIDEDISEADLEIPDVWWREDIEKIEDPEIREEEIEFAEKIIEKEKALNERLESGEITQEQYDGEKFFKIMPQGRKAATRSGLESVEVSHDVLGDISENLDFLIYDMASGDMRLTDGKKGIKKIVRELGPETAQDLADRMKEEEEEGIGEDAYETISRQVRLHGK